MTDYFDSNVLVAASVQSHAHHSPASKAVVAVWSGTHFGCTSMHALAETYAVLTRVPFRMRIDTAEAWHLLQENVLPYFKLVELGATDYMQAIQGCAARNHRNGLIYDALHVQAARKAQADRLLTFNVRHFEQLAPDLVGHIVAP